MLKILALEPYFGGSHRLFLEGLKVHSRHDWEILSLPASKWKWRMRHSAMTFSEQSIRLLESGFKWDLCFCSDMLNLAEWLGMMRNHDHSFPSIIYFHENQLTYPVNYEDERDQHFAFIHFSSGWVADQLWFNSHFHQESFYHALRKLLKKMPDFSCIEKVDGIEKKSRVFYPGMEKVSISRREQGPCPQFLWVARWEYDKNPDLFFAALKKLKELNVDFKLHVIGENFSRVPKIFDWAKDFFRKEMITWGYRKSRSDYLKVLQHSDIVISTAEHEFYGISLLEAVMYGALPLVPQRLAYPEVFAFSEGKEVQRYFYDGSLKHLVEKLQELIHAFHQGHLHTDSPFSGKWAEKFLWKNQITDADQSIQNLVDSMH